MKRKGYAVVIFVLAFFFGLYYQAQAAQYEGILGEEMVIRKISLKIEGCQVKAVFGKSQIVLTGSPNEETIVDKMVDNPGRFTLWPGGEEKYWWGAYEFVLLEGGYYKVTILLSPRSTGQSSMSMCSGRLLPKK